MRVVLLYAPPWKIAAAGESVDFGADGPPPGYRHGDLDADFYQIPYGLLSLGAQAIRAGHEVKVLNLSAFAWSKVAEIIGSLAADVFGLSCWTANRRGVALVASEIRARHPQAHIVVGGPHATPLAREMLEHVPAIDTVVRGEGDVTFLELLERLGRGSGTHGLAGAAYRVDGRVEMGKERSAIADLDTLASPQDHFDTHILMTSRGCPWACTFCGAETSWGRGFRAQSISYVVQALERATSRLPVKMIQIKDDTFTTNKKRVIELCRHIRERNLQFFWSCDTRVDLLTDELLREMRLAGCQRLSLGVESGSQTILDAIDKKITVDEIIASTVLAKKYGIKVRYYMMLGNRGETRETFEETLAFLERAQPHEYIFSCLSIYPGTKDFDAAVKAGWLEPKVYFEETFQEFKTPFDATPELTDQLNAWFADHSGLRMMWRDGLPEYLAILERLGDYHGAHMDVGAAWYAAGDLDKAEYHVRRARELGYPLPGLVYNHLACIAQARGDYDGMMDWFTIAARSDPQHHVLIRNVESARAWFKNNGPSRGLPLTLDVRHDFQLLERTLQPTLPGPLAESFASWTGADRREAGEGFVKTPDIEGSRAGLRQRKLPVVS